MIFILYFDVIFATLLWNKYFSQFFTNSFFSRTKKKKSDETLESITKKLQENGFWSVPVINEKKECIGTIDLQDLVGFLAAVSVEFLKILKEKVFFVSKMLLDI